jgi:hypothetical protein
MDKNVKGSYATFVIRNAGIVDEATYLKAENLYESVKGRNVDVEREKDDVGEKEAVGTENVPF